MDNLFIMLPLPEQEFLSFYKLLQPEKRLLKVMSVKEMVQMEVQVHVSLVI